MSEGDGIVSSSFSEGEDLREAAMENYCKLPPAVKRRVRALKKLQYETVKIDAAFYKDLLELEAKYDKEHQKIFEARKAIITGAKEPADEECDWPSDDEQPSAEGDEVEKLCDEVGNKAKVEDTAAKDSSSIAGVPDFWLQTLKNVHLTNDLIQDRDEDILKHLSDIKCSLHVDEPGFTLEFHFDTNPYFTNKILAKRYYFNYDIPADDPLSFEGPEIVRTKGCTINWNPGKNVTVKLIKKVQKKKGASGGGAKRTITKSVQENSFFNFFDPPLETLSEDLDEDIQLALESDFKIGQFLRDNVLPKAVLFFTGEACFPDSDDEDDEDDEDEDDDDDDDEDDDHHHKGRHHKGPKVAAGGEQPECKQQ